MDLVFYIMFAVIGSFVYFQCHKIKVDAAIAHNQEKTERELDHLRSKIWDLQSTD